MSASGASPGTLTGNIAWILRDAAAHAPARAAIITPGEGLSYDRLWKRSIAFARSLREASVQPGDRVVIFLSRGPTAAAAYFGTLAAGAIAVIANETLRPRQLEQILRQCGAGLLITSAEMLERQPRPLETEALFLDGEDLGDHYSLGDELVYPIPRAADDLAQIIYTSGSTGLPKGVMVTHGNLRAAIETVASYLGISGDDRTASLMPFSSVYGINQLLCSIFRASTLVIANSPLPHEVALELRREEITVLAAVPPLWSQLLCTPSFVSSPIGSIRIIQNAGGHLPEPAVRRLRSLYPRARLFLQYGLTEVIRSTFLPPEEVDRRPDSIGRPIPGAEVLVLREDLTPCAPGEIGELVHRGPTVTRGYWGDTVATESVFRRFPLGTAPDASTERVVFSGDLVRRDEEGFLYFVGRRDQMIKTLGHRVGPDEIASVLFASGEVQDALVAGEPDPRRGERIVAYIVLADGGSLERLQGFCGRELPRYMQPAHFEVRDALPRTSSGKHDLPALLRELRRERVHAETSDTGAG